MVKIGDVVTYVDENSLVRDALIQCVHNPDYINVVVISNDPSKEDSYGRQIEHATSVGRKAEFNKAGRHFIER
jgi:hypothetical protein